MRARAGTLARESAAYPAAREGRGAEGPPRLDQHISYENLADRTTAGDTDAELGRFSGVPDSIVLAAETNAARFTLRRRGQEHGRTLTVPAGQVVETHLAAEVVLVRNATALSNAVVTVYGKWAAREPLSPATSGHRQDA